MEGWDANRDGSPSEHTLRRWRNFGRSGAKLIWGGEAAAVRPDGRANPNQTLATESNRAGLAALLDELTNAHRDAFGSLDGLLVGLQLTHSGRFCKPDDHHKMSPRIAYHHPLLDAKFKIDPNDDSIVWTDAELEQLIDDYVAAAHLAHEVGFQFVDVKACHGYLLHEFLSARHRPGQFGGDLAGRSRLLLTIIDRIRNEVPAARDRRPAERVRLDPLRHQPRNRPADGLRQAAALRVRLRRRRERSAVDRSHRADRADAHARRPRRRARSTSRAAVPTTIHTCSGPPSSRRSTATNRPKIRSSASARQIDTVRQCKAALPDVPLVGSGYTYLQEYLPHVAQAVVREGWTDFVGLGRMVLSYPELPADTLAGRPLERKRLCRTFSDCTTAPRNGLISGCYPLDPHYKSLAEREELIAIKQRWQS